MISQAKWKQAQEKAQALFDLAGIYLTPDGRGLVEVADFGMNRREEAGLMLFTYINTQRWKISD